ncbi:hypothetical protein KEF29_23625 [Streptomyces tuirus]|uniref:Adhesin domain-containing protein n=1 Tax=Streptomyces tuirus TaxID=68278 RepID=A0A941FDM1_9ACTN|nr:hypothetical protein [Streptomyces tuirus]
MIDRAQRHDRVLFAAGAVLTVFVILYTSLFIASHLTRSSEHHNATYSGDFTRIEVSVSGTATVTGTSTSSVHADWDLSWSLFRPRIETDIDGSTLRLSVSCSNTPGRDCASSVALSVPIRAAVSVSAAGGVQATDVQGGLKARTRDGQLDLRDVKGAVDLGTRGGAINAEGLGGSELHARSRDGSMKLVFSAPHEASKSLHATDERPWHSLRSEMDTPSRSTGAAAASTSRSPPTRSRLGPSRCKAAMPT